MIERREKHQAPQVRQMGSEDIDPGQTIQRLRDNADGGRRKPRGKGTTVGQAAGLVQLEAVDGGAISRVDSDDISETSGESKVGDIPFGETGGLPNRGGE